MIFSSLIKTKEKLTTLPETATLEEALAVLEDTGFRCVPVLDQTGRIFRGNIYKMHLYRHKSRNGDMSLPVTALLKNATKFVSINAAFFSVFFAMRDLPYIAVLNNDNQFYGILTHNSMLRMLAAGWNVNNGSYVLTVTTPDERGSLMTASKEITRYCQIVNVLSFDPEHSALKQVLFTLPADVDHDKMVKIVRRLKKKGFEVPEIEDLKHQY
ncbi:cyclic di-AMP binding protein CbpA [Limosilactobacillus panis]|uniref:Cyclic di-AMP binding protein CbpA n=1 Tax=Limosilactobacillus panis TaxID=47493 RepID=A0ABT7VN83_9LACO|nr:cyclic di-AMP binding protein CbpA [Limosilactobacillus panis]MDM8334195.1 cyclic di-AMP binding protein CbpA [Limosilactobacillus panis]HJA22382.1 CBS domain-containing protein [Candidatus Limosilactobacillus intestinipullorum]